MNPVIRPRARDDIIRQFRWYLVEQDAPVQHAPLFTPTPKAAKRVLEFFTAQINADHTRKVYLNATRRFARNAGTATRGRTGRSPRLVRKAGNVPSVPAFAPES